MTLIDEPLLTTFVSREEVQLESNAAYMFGTGIEDRSVIGSLWRESMEARGARFVEIEELDDFLVLKSVGEPDLIISGRQAAKVVDYLGSPKPVYVDITGLSYAAWAPVVRALIDSTAFELKVIYVEPTDYSRRPDQPRGMQFELSEGFEGFRPIPGFAALRNNTETEWHLVAALGFEGARFSRVLSELEPASDRVVPVIGVPGFRPEFATQALLANREDLEDLTFALNIRFARANCPFDFFHTLHRVHADLGGGVLRIAPIGTKPHGLGSVLYTLSRPQTVQLVYDHPKRKAKRTLGASRVCIYDVSTFCESDLFRAQLVMP